MLILDNQTPEVRRRTMQAVRSSGSRMEAAFSRELWHRGLRFRKNVSGLRGKPDIAVKKVRVAIFLDSCFWHGCPEHGTLPSDNRDYWAAKIARTVVRDCEVSNEYHELGWTVLRFWEHELKSDFDRCVKIAEKALRGIDD